MAVAPPGHCPGPRPARALGRCLRPVPRPWPRWRGGEQHPDARDIAVRAAWAQARAVGAPTGRTRAGTGRKRARDAGQPLRRWGCRPGGGARVWEQHNGAPEAAQTAGKGPRAAHARQQRAQVCVDITPQAARTVPRPPAAPRGRQPHTEPRTVAPLGGGPPQAGRWGRRGRWERAATRTYPAIRTVSRARAIAMSPVGTGARWRRMRAKTFSSRPASTVSICIKRLGV
jgi:hypothetical protein